MSARVHGSRSTSLALAGAALIAVAGCLETTFTQVNVDDVTELRLGLDSMNVAVGRSVQAQALPLDEDGTLLSTVSATWSTLDPAIATVDVLGLVTGVASGTTQLVASAAGFADTAVVVVAPPPVLVLSADSSLFAAEAGQPDPPPDTIDVTNAGGFPLVGLTVDSIVYATTAGWLGAALGSSAAPTELELTVSTAGVSGVGVFEATVWVSATDADDSPGTVVVVLDLQPGPAASIEVSAGDGQIAQVGQTLPVDPSVLVLDALDNPVPGAVVTFAVTGGNGMVGAAEDTTDATGLAQVAWTLDETAGANTLDATLATVGTVSFSATGVPGPVTKLEIDGGDGQSAIAGSPVTTSPSAIALDDFDNPIAGVEVVFEVASGGGSITGSPDTTDVNGVATAGTWTLGAVGPNTVDAIAASIPDTVTFTATGILGNVDDLVLVAGDAQTDTVAATLATQYAVRVEDVNDNPIPGVTVSWEVTGGGGTIDGGASATSDTDGAGIAVATRILGTTPGTHTARVTIGGLADTVFFAATANVGTPAMLTVTAGGGQSATVGTSVGTPPTVKVGDTFDNGIGGYSLDLSVVNAGGAATPSGAVVTQADGTVAFTSWTLGTVAASASDTIQVTPSGGSVLPNPLLITATATADAPNDIMIVSGTGQTTVTGTDVSVNPTVLVRDQYLNPVPSQTVDFTTSGGSVGSSSPTTNAMGHASTSWSPSATGGLMQDDGTYPDTLTATVQGTGLSVDFLASARFSYPDHVAPIWNQCTFCHGLWTYAGIVDVRAFCDGTLPVGYFIVSSAGGVDAADDFSVLLRMVDPDLSGIGNCSHPFNGNYPSGAPQLDTIRGWIRNGAPPN